jgi:hypothetical protein
MHETVGLNRAGRRELERKKRKAAKRAAMSSGAMLVFGTSVAVTGGVSHAGLVSSFVVTTEDDVVDGGDAFTSLREAVEASNGMAGEDTITFAPGILDVEVVDGDLNLTDDVTITGPGVTVDAGGGEAGPHRIFDTELNAIDLTINGLTITGGGAIDPGFQFPFAFAESNGGAIRAESADVELNDVTVSNSFALNRGGGIYVGAEGQLRLTRSTISGNQASMGGGIWAGYYYQYEYQPGLEPAAVSPEVGGIVIDQSTISGNTAVADTPFKYNPGVGGGLSVYYTDLTIENSTISGNTGQSDAGGLYVYASEADISHSTVHGNLSGGGPVGGLQFNGEELTLDHSIFSGSEFTEVEGPQVQRYVGDAPYDVFIGGVGEGGASADWTLIQALADEEDDLDLDDASEALLGRNPLLGQLTDNGGDTDTHLPSGSSPVVNGGDPSFEGPPSSDQRDFARVSGGRIDIGSVEQAGSSSTPDPDSDPDPCENAPEDGFTDVPSSNVHETAVDCIAFLGITQGGPMGLPDDQYGPGLFVTRGQAASFIARLIHQAGAPLSDEPPDAFDDPETVHDLAINQLAEVGIVEGTGPRTYSPEELVTRGQMASLLDRTYLHITGEQLPSGPNAFTDDNESVHEDAINAIAAADIVRGTGDGLFEPNTDIRRDQTATFLTNFIRRLAQDDAFPVDG